jgi:hypothetical protein
MTAPVVAENIEPWQGQRNWSVGWKKPTVQPIWVQTALKATKEFSEGRTT